MVDETQTAFYFKVGDGTSPEAFTQLPGMREVPEIPGDQRTTRAARNVGDSGNTITHKFNALREGAEFSVTCDFLPSDVTQELLYDAIGSDTGVNVQTGITGATQDTQLDFNVIVLSRPFQPAGPNDAEAVDQITFNLKINGDVTETET